MLRRLWNYKPWPQGLPEKTANISQQPTTGFPEKSCLRYDWWPVTTQIRVVPLTRWSKFLLWHDHWQSEALHRSGWWNIVWMECLPGFAQCWKVLEFYGKFECKWPGKCFLMLFGSPRQNMNHSSENLKVIYIKCSMFYAIINYQFKTSELKNVEKLVKQTVQALKSY